MHAFYGKQQHLYAKLVCPVCGCTFWRNWIWNEFGSLLLCLLDEGTVHGQLQAPVRALRKRRLQLPFDILRNFVGHIWSAGNKEVEAVVVFQKKLLFAHRTDECFRRNLLCCTCSEIAQKCSKKWKTCITKTTSKTYALYNIPKLFFQIITMQQAGVRGARGVGASCTHSNMLVKAVTTPINLNSHAELVGVQSPRVKGCNQIVAIRLH